jgi:hypothetical protein
MNKPMLREVALGQLNECRLPREVGRDLGC